MEALLINPPSSNFPKSGKVSYKDGQGNILELPYEIKRVKIRKTDEEKKLHRRIYRQDYVNRPAVKDKIRAKLSDPEVQRKRKEYAAREEVKERKKVLAARTRALKRELKLTNPQLYQDLMNVVLNQDLPNPNHYTHREHESPVDEETQEREFPIYGTR